jgi:predicted nucleotidyltransferase
LTESEQQPISQAAQSAWLPGTRVCLFGSRVDDSGRGGDIDLLVELPTPLDASELVARRQDFVAGLYRLLGERRIDVVLAPPAGGPVSPVVQSARQQAVPLVVT